jgi:ArsR family transcriptional regulator
MACGWDLRPWVTVRWRAIIATVDASKAFEATGFESTRFEPAALEAASLEAASLEAASLEAAGLLAAVADPVRWRLLAHLASGTTMCVCDLRPIAAVAGNLLSYHLKVLREAGLVTTARRGRWVDYTIAADALDRLHAALPAAGTVTALGGSR